MVILSVVLLAQILIPSIVLANSEYLSYGNTEITFFKDNKIISVLDMNVGEENNLSIAKSTKENIIIKLPESIRLNEEKTLSTSEQKSNIRYNPKMNEVQVISNKSDNQKLIQLSIKALYPTSSSEYIKILDEETDSIISNLRVDVHDLRISERNSDAQLFSQEEKSYKNFDSKILSQQINLIISSNSESVFSGEDVNFNLDFKITGSKLINKNSKIIIPLPKNFELKQRPEELSILGVVPNIENDNILVYYFSQLTSGQATTKTFKFRTENGTVSKESKVTLKATFLTEGLDEIINSEDYTIVKSDAVLSLSHAYVKTINAEGQLKTSPPTADDTGTWQIKVAAPVKEKGMLYYKENSSIKVVYTIPKGLHYVGDNKGGIFDKEENTVTWLIPISTITQQRSEQENLFFLDILLDLKFDKEIQNQEKFVSKVFAEGKDITDGVVKKVSEAYVYAGVSNPNILPDGRYFWPNHGGPIDSKGTSGGAFFANNTDISVYDSSLLTYTFGATPGKTNSPTQNFDKYTVIYNIDDNLNISVLAFSGWAHYQPDINYPENVNLFQNPRVDVYLTVNGQIKKVLEDTDVFGHHFKLNDLGIDEDEHVSSIKIDFTSAPAGMMSPLIYPMFTVKKGFVGTVENKVFYDVIGYDNKGNRLSWNTLETMNNVNSASGPRTVQVIPYPSKEVPIISTSVKLNSSDGGVIDPKENQIIGELKNEDSSIMLLNQPFETMLLLPMGMKINKNNPEFQLSTVLDKWDEKTNDGNNRHGKIEIVDENYRKMNKQLIRIRWNDLSLSPGLNIKYKFNIELDKSAPTPLKLDTYSFTGDEDKQILSEVQKMGTSSLKKDVDDINKNGNKEENYVLSSNQYRMVKERDIKTKKMVKGNLDTNYSNIGHASVGGKIDYRLIMTNKIDDMIGNFVLMDVLPSKGDLGITDNTDRESKYSPILIGPIKLPKEWEGKATIKYSTATNPSRNELNNNVNYPKNVEKLIDPPNATTPHWLLASEVKNWEDIHSFIITLNDGEWTSGEKVTLDFSMKVPENLDRKIVDEDNEANRIAWNSFAYSVNNSQVVEPERVGVIVTRDFPKIHKDVKGEQTLKLNHLEEEFNWNIYTDFGSEAASWKNLSIEDQVSPYLLIKSVKVLDENNIDITSNGELDIRNNKIKFNVKKEGTYSYLNNKRYHMIVTTKLQKDIPKNTLISIVQNGGFKNQALLYYGDSELVKSEIPSVLIDYIEPKNVIYEKNNDGENFGGFKPYSLGFVNQKFLMDTTHKIALENQKINDGNKFSSNLINTQVPYSKKNIKDHDNPYIKKDIEGKQTYTIVNRDKIFYWNINVMFGKNTSLFKQVKISDQINPLLDIKTLEIMDDNGLNISNRGTFVIKNNKIDFTFHKENGNFDYVSGHVYTLRIGTTIAKDTNDNLIKKLQDSGSGISNQAVLQISNDKAFYSEIPKAMLLDMSNKITFKKIDNVYMQELQGAYFDLITNEGKILVKNLQSDDEGWIPVPKLNVGKYQLVERVAPQGYLITKNPINFVLSKHNDIKVGTYVNSIDKSNSFVLYTLVAITVFIVVCLVVFKNK
ncbi:Cna protein B-type domain protein [Enterococcus faecalis 02-MB-P-10]|nr:Cna protein B-type domain protein [Enterococcus faecalis 02-MB-P-10]